MRARGVSVALLVTMATAPSCENQGHTDPATNSTAGAPVDRYCEEMVDAYCGFYLRCGRIAATTPESCRSIFLESCNGRYERWYGALAGAGLLRLSDDGMAACQAHLAQVSCTEQIKDLDGACEQMWVGTQPVGAACGLGLESLVCEPTAACVLTLSMCGSCTEKVELGFACDLEHACADNATCKDGSCVSRAHAGESCARLGDCLLGLSCVEGTCVAPVYASAGSSCNQGERCVYGTMCIAGSCQLDRRDAEACDADTHCLAGLCSQTAPAVCIPLKEPGASCATHAECLFGACVNGSCNDLPSGCFAL